jgi:ribose transport system ATP-binding protein
VLEAVAVSKRFAGTQALDGVSLRVAPGEVVAVVGENGAGKSTLMKILAGVQEPDAGTLRLDGREIRLRSVAEAQRAGIALIHQELNLADSLDVAANLYLGREPTVGGPLRLVSTQIDRDAERILQRLGLDVSPRTRVDALSLGQRQLVEIGRALSLESRYIIFDEPTSSLTERETARLFAVIRSLKTSGVGVLYISHRLPEICELCDRAVVLRDGRPVGELARGEITHRNLVERMVGRELKQLFHRAREVPPASGTPRIEVQDLRWSPTQREGVTFSILPGQVVGVAGLMGSGRTELAETLFGLRRRLGGTVRLNGTEVRIDSPRDALQVGIALVPEDRRRQGLVIDFPIFENIGLPSLDRLSRFGLVDHGAETALAESTRERLGVRTSSVRKVVGLLSGGNQQKVVLGKWLARDPRLLILDEPTRGVDVGAKAEIYAVIDRLAARGTAVMMISSDLEEIIGVSDAVVVMHEQKVAGSLRLEQLTEQAIMHLATGGDAGR